jgi:putative transposase
VKPRQGRQKLAQGGSPGKAIGIALSPVSFQPALLRRLEGGRGDTLAHTFSKNYVHVIFSTKDRRKLIEKEFRPRLWAYLAGIAKNHDINMLAVGGTEDHIHLLFHLPPKLALAKAVLLLKANSSKWMSKGLSWQEGYGAFSVSSSNIGAVIRYIQNQEKHHRKFSFEEEFRAILRRHGIEYDPRDLLG